MSYFDSADPLLISAAVLFAALFTIYVVRVNLCSGSVFTLSNFVVVKAYLIPIVFVGFVTISDKQSIAYKHLYVVRENIGAASTLAILSLFILFAGFFYANSKQERSRLPKCLYKLGRNIVRIDYLLILVGTSALLFLLAISLGAKFGSFRGYGLENRRLLPVFAALNAVASFGLAVAIASFHEGLSKNQKRLRLLIMIYLTFVCLGVGTRSALLDPLIVGLAAYLQSRGKNGVTLAVILLPALIFLGISIAYIREGAESSASALVELQNAFLYGSNFPDFRNLAMILGALPPPSESAYHGKTIFSSALSFIPSSGLAFRADYAWGNIVPDALNFNAQHHPGVRGLPFTEWYFNFGLVGLAVSSFIYGYILRLVGFAQRYTGRDRAFYIIGAYFFYKFFGFFFTTTPNLAQFYPVFFLLMFTILLRKISYIGSRRTDIA